MLTFFFSILLLSLGPLAGLVIGLFAKEELEPGRRYLKLLRLTLLLAILAIFFFKNQSFLFIVILPALMIILSLFKDYESLYYYSLPIFVYLSWAYNGFLIIAPLVFLYGLPVGSLYLLEKMNEPVSVAGKKGEKKTAKKDAAPLKQTCVLVRGVLVKYSPFLALGILLSILGLVL